MCQTSRVAAICVIALSPLFVNNSRVFAQANPSGMVPSSIDSELLSFEDLPQLESRMSKEASPSIKMPSQVSPANPGPQLKASKQPQARPTMSRFGTPSRTLIGSAPQPAVSQPTEKETGRTTLIGKLTSSWWKAGSNEKQKQAQQKAQQKPATQPKQQMQFAQAQQAQTKYNPSKQPQQNQRNSAVAVRQNSQPRSLFGMFTKSSSEKKQDALRKQLAVEPTKKSQNLKLKEQLPRVDQKQAPQIIAVSSEVNIEDNLNPLLAHGLLQTKQTKSERPKYEQLAHNAVQSANSAPVQRESTRYRKVERDRYSTENMVQPALIGKAASQVKDLDIGDQFKLIDQPKLARSQTGNTKNQILSVDKTPSQPEAAQIVNHKVEEATPGVSQYPVATVTEPLKVAPAEPSGRAKELLIEAHTIASRAGSLEDYTAIVQRCRTVYAIDDSIEALRYANQLASWSLNKRGELLFDLEQVEDAEADFREAIQSSDDCWRALHNLGVILARRGDFDEALHQFEQTIQLNPEFAKAYANKASIVAQLGDFESGLDLYLQAIKIDPDLIVAHEGRGRLCHVTGDLSQALSHLDAALLLSPEDPFLNISRGDLLLDMGRYGQAKLAYQQAIKIDNRCGLAYRNLAWLQATCPSNAVRDPNAAVENSERALELAGDQATDIDLDTHAAALAAVGRFDEAISLTTQVIDMAPEIDVPAYQERLQMYERGESIIYSPFDVQTASYLSE